MTISAQEIVAAIAPNEATFLTTPDQYSGFVRKATKTRVDFHWKRALPGKPDEMTINKHGVICSRTPLNGRTWFGYTLDPFGPEVSYSVEREVADKLLQTYVGQKATGR